jgi:hypothetical protein
VRGERAAPTAAPAPTTTEHAGLAALTEREREILLAVASGMSTAEDDRYESGLGTPGSG